MKTIVVGGGAAGMFCAGMLAQGGVDTTIIEHSAQLGKKILITGKGRCNVTNDCDEQTFLKNVRTNPRFLYSAIYAFNPHDTMRFFTSLGVALKTERGNRVFPVSDRADDIRQALIKHCEAARINYAEVKKLLFDGERVIGVALSDGKKLFADNVVVATGGLSYKNTGSTGDGYTFAKSAGHTVIPPTASLVPLVAQGNICAEMMGLSLRNVNLSVECRGKTVFSQQGEMLFTHFGISGPLVLTASSYLSDSDIPDSTAVIDLKPALTEEVLYDRICRDFARLSAKNVSNCLDKLLPKSMIEPMLTLWGVDREKKTNQVTKQERQRLVKLLKGFRIPLKSKYKIDIAVITCGGVATKELNPKTMASKLKKGLYFIGETVDVDAYTGGFNLQIAFSTAYICAQDIISQQEKEKNMVYSVALDGPSGAGKSTIAKKLAQQLGIIYVDTGAMYRVIGLYMYRNGIDTKDAAAVCDNLSKVNISTKHVDGLQRMFLNGEDVTDEIRKDPISMAASNVSAIPQVRAFLLQTQRNFATENSVIMDGRDIGTVVLPDAQVKIFLTADTTVRAQRRYKELCEKGQDVDFDTILQQIERRDYQDTHRETAPLKQREDAVLLDTSELDFDGACAKVREIIQQKVGIKA